MQDNTGVDANWLTDKRKFFFLQREMSLNSRKRTKLLIWTSLFCPLWCVFGTHVPSTGFRVSCLSTHRLYRFSRQTYMHTQTRNTYKAHTSNHSGHCQHWEALVELHCISRAPPSTVLNMFVQTHKPRSLFVCFISVGKKLLPINGQESEPISCEGQRSMGMLFAVHIYAQLVSRLKDTLVRICACMLPASTDNYQCGIQPRIMSLIK